MGDLIDRQAAIDALTRKMVSIPTAGGKDLMYDVNRIREEDILVIKRLPSAEPKKGKWIKEPYSERLVTYRCSECMKVMGLGSNKSKWYKFCPNCGSAMK